MTDWLDKRYADLTGTYKHWCNDWDALPVDETCIEFTMCSCFDSTPQIEELRVKLRSDFEAQEAAYRASVTDKEGEEKWQ